MVENTEYERFTVLYFETTGDAYDYCQHDDTIKNGDILVVKDEGVVGFAGTWPVAITTLHGNFHVVAPGYVILNTIKDVTETSLELARMIADGYGFQTR